MKLTPGVLEEQGQMSAFLLANLNVPIKQADQELPKFDTQWANTGPNYKICVSATNVHPTLCQQRNKLADEL